ncbi:hypothetical protein N0V94_008160 [Neodidymelliopsis sp. IMI 364377]|nr:hypothetical protein N0V94_008160 [Neodidymelliopsis sp. IMI 364377]
MSGQTGSTLRPSDIEQSGSNSQRSAFGQGVRLLDTTDKNSALQMQLGRLDTLPARMADALGKPEDIRDVLTALSAIVTLIDSCVAGFEIDAAAFWAMVTWLSKASEEFHHMLSRDDPAALIVLAHWAGSLVRRVEDLGCWFLQGATGFILAEVRVRLQEHGTLVLKLVEEF